MTKATSKALGALAALQGPTALFCPCGKRINEEFSLLQPALWYVFETYPMHTPIEHIYATERVRARDALAQEDYVDDE